MEGSKKAIRMSVLTIHLTEQEERCLLEMMRSPMHGQSPENEGPAQRAVRTGIYNLIVDGEVRSS